MKRLILLVICLLVLVFPSSGLAGTYHAPEDGRDLNPLCCSNQAPRLAVMSALVSELEELVERAEIHNSCVINGRTFYIGKLSGNKVVLFLSGMSMVNAAMMIQTALDHFNVIGIVFSGIAGGVNPGLNIGDVTVPARWAQYQENLFARETPEGWDVGLYTDVFGNFGMMFPQFVSVTRKGETPDAEKNKFWFEVDPEMLRVAARVGNQVKLNTCTPEGMCLDHEPIVVVGGNGASGQTFVDNAEYRDWVWGNFEADALDMESAAVAHVAYVNQVPFIAFRSLSDLAGGGAGENHISTFLQLAAENSSRVVVAFLKEWSEEH